MKTLLGCHYFVYFGTLGIFLPYFNLYCRHLGFSGFEIGLISSVKTAVVMVFPILWAMAADKFNARKSIFIFCAVMSTLFWVPLFYTRSFVSVFWFIALQSLFYAPIVSFLEAFAMEILGKAKKRYGRSRVWGSIAFIICSMGLGRIFTTHPMDMIIPLILLGLSLQVMLSLKLPPGQTGQRDNRPLSLAMFRLFFTKNASLFLLAAFLMLVSHGAYYGFFSIYLESLGFSPRFIGFAWGLAVMAEIAVMTASASLFSRFSLKTILIFSFSAAALRWFSLFTTGIAPNESLFSSGGFILLSQLLHAFTYGSFHIASILAVDTLSRKSGSTFGQAVNNAVTYGAGMTMGFMISGVYYDQMEGGLFLASGICALLGGITLITVTFESDDAT